jgi:hypothetical protein
VLREVEAVKPTVLENEARSARRFALQIPVRYRLRGEKAWRHGETENVSSSGVLFRTVAAAETGASVELCLKLPVPNSEAAGEVLCRGVIVRSLRPRNGDLPALAIRIQHFRLARG